MRLTVQSLSVLAFMLILMGFSACERKTSPFAGTKSLELPAGSPSYTVTPQVNSSPTTP
jgi:hypothetical protein